MKLRMDALHYALLAVVVLLAVYCGASFFREGIHGAHTIAHSKGVHGPVHQGPLDYPQSNENWM